MPRGETGLPNHAAGLPVCFYVNARAIVAVLKRLYLNL